MPLDEDIKAEIKIAVVEAIREEFGDFHGVLCTLGEGKVEKGVEVLRENSIFVKKQREISSRVSMAIILIVVSSVLSGALYALWSGIKSMVGG